MRFAQFLVVAGVIAVITLAFFFAFTVDTDPPIEERRVGNTVCLWQGKTVLEETCRQAEDNAYNG